MGIIKELLNEIESNELDQQMKELCDKIVEEEKVSEEYGIPTGINIFLSIPCPGTFKNEIGCLCLEREMQGIFIVSFWTKLKSSNSNFKKVKTWDDSKIFNESEKILKFYAQKLKYLKGDI